VPSNNPLDGRNYADEQFNRSKEFLGKRSVTKRGGRGSLHSRHGLKGMVRDVEELAVVFVTLVPLVRLFHLFRWEELAQAPPEASLPNHLEKFIIGSGCDQSAPTARPSCHYKMWIIVS